MLHNVYMHISLVCKLRIYVQIRLLINARIQFHVHLEQQTTNSTHTTHTVYKTELSLLFTNRGQLR